MWQRGQVITALLLMEAFSRYPDNVDFYLKKYMSKKLPFWNILAQIDQDGHK